MKGEVPVTIMVSGTFDKTSSMLPFFLHWLVVIGDELLASSFDGDGILTEVTNSLRQRVYSIGKDTNAHLLDNKAIISSVKTYLFDTARSNA